MMWFRRDLRLADLPALLAAGADGRTVVPLFVARPGLRPMPAAPRRALLHDVLSSLDADIRERFGSRLLIRNGDPVVEVSAIAAALDVDTVYVSRDYAPYGRRRDAASPRRCRSRGASCVGVGSPYAVDPGRVLKGDGTPYKVFTPFSKVWREIGAGRPEPEPGDDIGWAPARRTERVLPFPCSIVQIRSATCRWSARAQRTPGGPRFSTRTSAADGTMRSGVEAYNDLRDQPALAGTSQLSADLKWGTIHPRSLLADLDLSGPKDDGADGLLERAGLA